MTKVSSQAPVDREDPHGASDPAHSGVGQADTSADSHRHVEEAVGPPQHDQSQPQDFGGGSCAHKPHTLCWSLSFLVAPSKTWQIAKCDTLPETIWRVVIRFIAGDCNEHYCAAGPKRLGKIRV
jgi:hypothetical protein